MQSVAMLALVVFAALFSVVKSNCDNACSGHGTCMTDDVCSCYDNWGVGQSHDSGDCSDRVCPYELAWVDTPDKKGAFHKYQECAGRGICDRTTGECTCFDGYEGKACARTSCPNDCSGHGTCEFIDDMVFGANWFDYTNKGFFRDGKKFAYYNWDASKTRGCVCDAHFGDVDCSKRMCPYGTDVLDVRDDLLLSTKYQVQELRFIANDETLNTGGLWKSITTSGSNSSNTGGIYTLNGETFALTFKSRLNETFTTIPISFDPYDLNDLVHDIQLALLSLPNRVIDGITVAAARDVAGIYPLAPSAIPGGVIDGNAGDGYGMIGGLWNQARATATSMVNMIVVNVTFTGPSVQGPQHMITVEDYECSSGCTPKISGLALQYRANHWTNNATEIQLADYNSYECGRRGKCDYTTGLCACFLGYTGDNCNTLTTLV